MQIDSHINYLLLINTIFYRMVGNFEVAITVDSEFLVLQTIDSKIV